MPFTPEHISANEQDFEGNAGAGRFLLLPGSKGRAARIAERLQDVTVKPHPRGHDLHLGVFTQGGVEVDVGVVATGMGGPSVEIIVSELLALGARCLLRVGTSGSLQRRVEVGHIVIATGAVRDEAAGDAYLPREFPAMASLALVDALRFAARERGMMERCHSGLVHSKDSLYAREFAHGPLAAQHREYRDLLTAGGVLSSEMECATLFTMCGVADQDAQCAQPPRRVHCGAVLAVIGGAHAGFARNEAASSAEEEAIEVALSALVDLRRTPDGHL